MWADTLAVSIAGRALMASVATRLSAHTHTHTCEAVHWCRAIDGDELPGGALRSTSSTGSTPVGSPMMETLADATAALAGAPGEDSIRGPVREWMI